MQIDRDWVFDFIDMLGGAVSNARLKPASPEWDFKGKLEMLIDEIRRAKDAEFDSIVKKEAEAENNHWNLFENSTWKDEPGGGLEEPSKRQEWSPYGSEAFEQANAQKFKEQVGRGIAKSLERIQRMLAKRKIGVYEALKRLQELCDSIAGAMVSWGWSHRIRQIIDELSD